MNLNTHFSGIAQEKLPSSINIVNLETEIQSVLTKLERNFYASLLGTREGTTEGWQQFTKFCYHELRALQDYNFLEKSFKGTKYKILWYLLLQGKAQWR